MSDYTFLPWIRQGLSRHIAEADTLGKGEGAAIERAEVDVKLNLGYVPVGSDKLAADTLLIEHKTRLLGPGDAKSLRARALIENVPPAGSTSFPSNYLASVTFYDEDLPWRLTPAAPSEGQLRPWMALLVLKPEEFEFVPGAEQLGVVTVKAAASRSVLPPQEELWAWAHVHITGNVTKASDLQSLRASKPNLVLSRLLAPRRLRADQRYQAFVVPSFETGRLAGLGESTAAVPAQRPAWPTEADYVAGRATPKDIRLPVYHQWSFETRDEGDFEALVSALRPRVAGGEFGLRAMDISSPGFGLDGLLTDKTLPLEGALQPALYSPPSFPKASAASEVEYVSRLRKLLDLGANLAAPMATADLPALHPFSLLSGATGFSGTVADDPILVPPTYGQWHAGVQRLADAPKDRPWLGALNLDPRQRVAASAGARVVRAQDDELVARAWEQVGEVLAANQRLREAELAVHVGQGIHDKHVAPLDDDRLMVFARSAQASILPPGSALTALGCIEASPVPSAALSAAFRRAVSAAPQSLMSGLVTGFNAKTITAAAPKTAFSSSVTIAEVTDAVDLAATKIATQAQETSHQFVRLLSEDLATRAGVLPDIQTWKAQLLGRATSPDLKELVGAIGSVIANATSAQVGIDKTKFEKHFETGVKGVHYGGLVVEAIGGGPGRYGRVILPADVDRFKQGVASFKAGALQKLPTETGPTARTDLPAISSALRSELAPMRALPLRMKHLVVIEDAGAASTTLSAPVMASPHFPEAQFDALKRLSFEFVIPNVQGLPINSITLFEPNQRFIEAFLAGMNHEMARELLWREYPTDMRGTYFDRFWDIGDSLASKPLPDIQPMTGWVKALGENSPQGKRSLLVLAIRSELFRQYPRTLVYAQRAVWQTDGSGERRDLPRRLQDPPMDGDLKFPAFTAELEPDIGIFAFELDGTVARGEGGDAGWFFVLKERPGQPRFGADDSAAGVLEDWDSLTYQHLVFSPSTPDLLRVQGNTGPNLVPTSTDPSRPIAARWGRSAADTAYALLQAPVLYARHAAEMLPPAA
jgi:hypothetical protein